MNKMNRIYFWVLSVSALLLISGCGESNLIGTWVNCDDEIIIDFSGRKIKISDFSGNIRFEGTYEFKGSRIKSNSGERGLGTIVIKSRYRDEEAVLHYDISHFFDGYSELIVDGNNFFKGKINKCDKAYQLFGSSSGKSLARAACKCKNINVQQNYWDCINKIKWSASTLSEEEKKIFDTYVCD